MRLVRFLKAIGAVAIVNLGLALAAPQGPSRDALSKRTWVNSCDNSALALLTHSIDEMTNMVVSLFQPLNNLSN
jgi:hypothetical protein